MNVLITVNAFFILLSRLPVCLFFKTQIDSHYNNGFVLFKYYLGLYSLKLKKDYDVWNTVYRSFGSLNEFPDNVETEPDLPITATGFILL